MRLVGLFSFATRATRAARATRAPLVSSLGLGAMLLACAGKSSESTATEESALLGQDGTDTNEVEAQTSSLTATFALAPSASAAMSVEAALASAEDVRAYFAPAGCLTVTTDAARDQATYVFDACSGPWGLVHVMGTVVATYTTVTTPAGAPAIHIDAVGTALHLRRATADYHASATIVTSGIARAMSWTGELSGVTARGRAFQRSAAWDVRWRIGEACVDIDGTAKGDVRGRSFVTTVRHYARCRDACPQAGGDVTVTDVATGRAVDIAYDGSSIAIATSNGSASAIALACGL